MTRFLFWIKANPVIGIAAALALGSVAGMLLVNLRVGYFLDRVNERVQVVQQIEAMKRTPVLVPPTTPDQPLRQESIAVNQAAIDELTRAYNRMSREYTEIFKLAVSINQDNHRPMVDGLFPEPRDAGIPFTAKNDYRKALLYMLGLGPAAADMPYPRIIAGEPPAQDKIVEELEALQEVYLKSNFFPPKKIEELVDVEAEALNQVKSRKLIELLQEHARSLQLYAQVDPKNPAEFAMDLGAWVLHGQQPKPEELWEGQMCLWIQQDLIEAIARANRVDDPESNVMTAPVKRLLRIRVLPGYVGVDSRGGFEPAENGSRPTGPTPRQTPMAEAAPPATAGPDSMLSDDFSITPSGRLSNPLYDVRHVAVSLVVDAQQLPTLFACLQQVNFMCVLRVELTDVDEYEALRHGYVYGSGDAVQADLLIETVWLRDWTTPYMPGAVAKRLAAAGPRP